MPSEGQEFLDELERLADPEDLPALLNACLGRRVYVPRGIIFNDQRKSWIKDAIGPEKAEKLIRKFACESYIFGDIDVPIREAGHLSRRLSDARFIAAVRAGQTNGQIAREFGISYRAVTLRKQKLRRKGVDLVVGADKATNGDDE